MELRLARVLRLAARKPEASLAELALDAGYSDQPHFNREFRELTDMAPGEYRSAGAANAHHVKFLQRLSAARGVPCAHEDS